jgi:hypothetical protein
MVLSDGQLLAISRQIPLFSGEWVRFDTRLSRYMPTNICNRRFKNPFLSSALLDVADSPLLKR